MTTIVIIGAPLMFLLSFFFGCTLAVFTAKEAMLYVGMARVLLFAKAIGEWLLFVVFIPAIMLACLRMALQTL